MNSDLDPGDARSRRRPRSSSPASPAVCRTFAPIYRQMTLGAVAAVAAGAGRQGRRFRIAYGDVARRLARLSRQPQQGPPVRPDRPQPGLADAAARSSPTRSRASPTARADEARRSCPASTCWCRRASWSAARFKSTPLCSQRRPDRLRHDLGQLPREERRRRPAPSSACAAQPGMTVACTNPARPGATAGSRSTATGTRARRCPCPGGPITWSTEGAPPTPFLRTEGLVSAPLRQRRPARLSRRSAPTPIPSDKRTDRIGGEVGVARHVHPRLGHAPGRHEPAPQGDLDPAGRGAKRREIGQRPAALTPLFDRRGLPPRIRAWLRRRVMEPSPFDHPYRGGFVGAEHRFALTRLFRGHRHRRDRLLRQLSQLHGAGAVRHAPRRRHRPARRARGRRGRLCGRRGRHPLPQPGQARRRSASSSATVERGPRRQRAHSSASHARDRNIWPTPGSPPPSSTPDGRPQRQPRDWVERFRAIASEGSVMPNCEPAADLMSPARPVPAGRHRREAR